MAKTPDKKQPLPTAPANTQAGDIEKSTITFNNFTQSAVDMLQALCNEYVQKNNDPNGVYAHLIVYLQQYSGTTLSLTGQQTSVLQALIQEAIAKGHINSATQTTLLAAVK